jgi:hypothetical protein
MKMFICLAITCLLVGLLYVYVRQQLKYQNDQMEQLMGMVKCIVAPHEHEIPRLEPRSLTKVVVSDDESEESEESEAEESEESDSESIESVEPPLMVDPVTVDTPKNEVEEVTELSTSDMVCDIKEVKVDDMANMLNIIGVDISCVLRPVDLETLSVKELRSKVAEVGGPTFKTKREMIQYLNSR